MTDSLIEISDKFIVFFIKANGVRKDKELFDFIKEESINITLPEIINILIAYKLIERSSVHAELKHLTPNGFNAAIIGIKKHIEEIEYDKELDRKVKKATITTSRWAIGISILSLIISIIIPVLIEKQKDELLPKKVIKNAIENNKINKVNTKHEFKF
jgi:hypothetical protein